MAHLYSKHQLRLYLTGVAPVELARGILAHLETGCIECNAFVETFLELEQECASEKMDPVFDEAWKKIEESNASSSTKKLVRVFEYTIERWRVSFDERLNGFLPRFVGAAGDPVGQFEVMKDIALSLENGKEVCWRRRCPESGGTLFDAKLELDSTPGRRPPLEMYAVIRRAGKVSETEHVLFDKVEGLGGEYYHAVLVVEADCEYCGLKILFEGE